MPMNAIDELAGLEEELDDYTAHKRAAELQEFEEQFTVQNIADRRKEIVSKIVDNFKTNPVLIIPILILTILFIFPAVLRVAYWWWSLLLIGVTL